MALQLHLEEDLEKQLRMRATALGMGLEDYASMLLADAMDTRPRTGKEVVEQLRRDGFIGSRPDIQDSVAHARELRSRASRRER